MDGDRFDAMTRTLGFGHSRRRVLKTLAGGALGTVAASLGLGEARARGSGQSAPPRPFGAGCNVNAQCASGVCRAEKGRGAKTCGCAPAGGTCGQNGDCCGAVCVHGVCNGGVSGPGGPCDDSGDCAAGLSCCGAPGGQTCVDVMTDLNNCGSCGASCNDNDVCTTDACSGGACVNTPITCSGGDQCHAASCDPIGGCTTTPLSGTACDSGSGASSGTCQAGTCVANQTCVGITPGTAQCAADADCGDERVCLNGGCFMVCAGEPSRCRAGVSCTACRCDLPIDPGGNLVCADHDYHIGSCLSNADCPAGSFCDMFPVTGALLCVRPCPTLQ